MAGSRPTMNDKKDPFGGSPPIDALIRDTSKLSLPPPSAADTSTEPNTPVETPVPELVPEADKEPPKEKVTVLLPKELLERLRNAAWHKRETLASLAEDGIRVVVEKLEKRNGGPFEPRENNLKPGRPQGPRNGKTRKR